MKERNDMYYNDSTNERKSVNQQMGFPTAHMKASSLSRRVSSSSIREASARMVAELCILTLSGERGGD
jgi:hypothetical protein